MAEADTGPSGYYGDPEREVQANCVRRLDGHGPAPLREKRISGPLTDCLAGESDAAGPHTRLYVETTALD